MRIECERADYIRRIAELEGREAPGGEGTHQHTVQRSRRDREGEGGSTNSTEGRVVELQSADESGVRVVDAHA